MYKLNGHDMVLLAGAHYCKYCGEVAIADGHYYNHGRDYEEEHHCNCEGARVSSELSKKAYQAYSEYSKLEKEVLQHRDFIHKSIKKLQLEEELKPLQNKYGAEIVYVLKEEN